MSNFLWVFLAVQEILANMQTLLGYIEVVVWFFGLGKYSDPIHNRFPYLSLDQGIYDFVLIWAKIFTYKIQQGALQKLSMSLLARFVYEHRGCKNVA